MENLDFGWQFGAFMYALFILILIVRVILSLAIMHFLTQSLAPATARLFGYSDRLTGTSRYDFFAYMLTFIFIAPIIDGILIFIFQMFIFMDYFLFNDFYPVLDSFSIFYFYLISLTIWFYDRDLDKFRLRSFGTILRHGMAFVVLSILTNFSRLLGGGTGHSILDFAITALFSSLIVPVIFVGLTIFYMKKNKRTDV